MNISFLYQKNIDLKDFVTKINLIDNYVSIVQNYVNKITQYYRIYI